MGEIITINLFKGGVGKSTLTQMLAYNLEKMGYKTLVIDVDPQANVTKKLLRTYEDLDLMDKPSFFEGIKSGSFHNCVVEITPHLFIIPGGWDTIHLEQFIAGKVMKAKSVDPMFTTFREQVILDELREKFDYILFDTIPTTSMISNNCICASDYVLVPTQTEQDSIDNLDQMLQFIEGLKEDYQPQLKILGIVPYLVDQTRTSKVLLSELKETYTDLVFDNIVKQTAVVKRWGMTGVTTTKPYDYRSLEMYQLITDEFLKRVRG